MTLTLLPYMRSAWDATFEVVDSVGPIGNADTYTATRKDPTVLQPRNLSSRLSSVPAPSRRRHIAVASVMPYHSEVYDALVWTLERIIRKHSEEGITVSLYESSSEGEFTNLMKDLEMVTVPVRRSEDLRIDISRTDLFGKDGEMIDMVLLGTCEGECVKRTPTSPVV